MCVAVFCFVGLVQWGFFVCVGFGFFFSLFSLSVLKFKAGKPPPGGCNSKAGFTVSGGKL